MSTTDGILSAVECSAWKEVTKTLDGMLCFWSDLDGIHLATAPALCPIATHLWGFKPDAQWARVRIEDDRLLVSILSGSGSVSTSPSEIAVRYTMQEHRAWNPLDKRVQQADLTNVPESLQVVEVDGISPLTFLTVKRR